MLPVLGPLGQQHRPHRREPPHAGQRANLRRVSRQTLRRRGVIWILGGDRTATGFEADMARPRPRHRDRRLRQRGLRRRPDELPPARRRDVLHLVPRRPVARLQHAPDRARSRPRPSRAGSGSPRTTTARPSNRCSTASRSTRTIRWRFAHASSATRSTRTSASARTGTSSPAPPGHTYGNHSVWQMYSARPEARQWPAVLLERSDPPARRQPDAVRPRAGRIAAVPFARPGPVPRRQRARRRRPHRATRGDGYAFIY